MVLNHQRLIRSNVNISGRSAITSPAHLLIQHIACQGEISKITILFY